MCDRQRGERMGMCAVGREVRGWVCVVGRQRGDRMGVSTTVAQGWCACL